MGLFFCHFKNFSQLCGVLLFKRGGVSAEHIICYGIFYAIAFLRYTVSYPLDTA